MLRSVRTVIATTAVVLALGALASAQASTVKIGFNFLAGSKTLAAGTYSVDVAANGNIVLTPEAGGAAIGIPQLKALSKRNVTRVEMMFDVVGSAHYLSEVWVPGKGRFQVATVPSSEERETVTGPNVK